MGSGSVREGSAGAHWELSPPSVRPHVRRAKDPGGSSLCMVGLKELRKLKVLEAVIIRDGGTRDPRRHGLTRLDKDERGRAARQLDLLGPQFLSFAREGQLRPDDARGYYFGLSSGVPCFPGA